MTDVYSLMLQRRSIRKFKPDPIPSKILVRAVNAARLAPCGANAQSLKFYIVQEPKLVAQLFSLSKWGMHLPDGSACPKEGERPTAWLLILHDQAIPATTLAIDMGIAGEHAVLCALNEGVGSCWILNMNFKKAAEILDLPAFLEIHAAIALGYPNIEPQAVALPPSRSTKYYWEETGNFCVPKRSLSEVMLVDKSVHIKESDLD